MLSISNYVLLYTYRTSTIQSSFKSDSKDPVLTVEYSKLQKVIDFIFGRHIKDLSTLSSDCSPQPRGLGEYPFFRALK